MTKTQKTKWEKVAGFMAGHGVDEDGKNGSAIYYAPTIDKTLSDMKRIYKITSIEVNSMPEWAKNDCIRIRFELKA